MDLFDKEFLGYASTIIALLNLFYYLWTVYKGQTKPHCFTWLIWALAMGVTFFAQTFELAGPGAWMTGISALGCLSVAIIGYFYGEKHITRSDKIALAIGLSAIPIWIMTDNPAIAATIVTLIDASGYYPTIRKSYRKPREEPAVTYAIAALILFLSLMATETYNYTTMIYLATFTIVNIFVVLYLLILRRIRHEHA